MVRADEGAGRTVVPAVDGPEERAVRGTKLQRTGVRVTDINRQRGAEDRRCDRRVNVDPVDHIGRVAKVRTIDVIGESGRRVASFRSDHTAHAEIDALVARRTNAVVVA